MNLLWVLERTVEVVLLALITFTPWFFAGMDPFAEWIISLGVVVLALLWAAHTLLSWRLTIPRCYLTLCLVGLFAYVGWQVTPLSPELLKTLSPSAYELRQQMLPAQPEVVSGGGVSGVHTSGPVTLSLYPYATRTALGQIAILFVFFFAARTLATSSGAFKRLAVVVVLNGTALVVFGLVQNLSSGSHLLYWTYQTDGTAYGPFVNRNHFAFYINLSLGVGLGLMASLLHQRQTSLPGGSRRSSRRSSRSSRGSLAPGGRAEGARSILSSPALLWLSLALGLMLLGPFVSLSRGGMVACLMGGLVCFLTYFYRSRVTPNLGPILVVAAIGVMFLLWLGVEAMRARFLTIQDPEDVYAARVELWERTGPWFQAYPIWGTGEGTFVFVERLYIHQTSDVGVKWEHAHNEYLEAVLEGGVIRLALFLLLLGLAVHLCLRALETHRRHATGGLAYGLLFAFTTLLMHSFVEFGLHIPAIMLLAAVLGAQASAAASDSNGVSTSANASPKDGSSPTAHHPPAAWASLGGIAPAAGAILAGVFAVGLLSDAWKRYNASRLQNAAVRLQKISGEEARLLQIKYLEAASRITPQDAEIQADLGQAHLNLFEEKKARLRLSQKIREIPLWITVPIQGLLGTGTGSGSLGMAASFTLLPATAQLHEEIASPQIEAMEKEHVRRGLVHYLRARDLCPILPHPHLRIAAYHHVLAQADAVEDYLDRVKRLVPSDPRLWLLCGIQELEQDHLDLACRSWRRSLELSDEHLKEIIKRSSDALSAEQVLEEVLPDKPELIFFAAFQLYPEEDMKKQRRPFMKKALSLLSNSPDRLKPENLRLKGIIHAIMGELPDAIECYQSATRYRPDMIEWRFEYATLLRDNDELEEAREQLLWIRRRSPNHPPAMQMLSEVNETLLRER